MDLTIDYSKYGFDYDPVPGKGRLETKFS